MSACTLLCDFSVCWRENKSDWESDIEGEHKCAYPFVCLSVRMSVCLSVCLSLSLCFCATAGDLRSRLTEFRVMSKAFNVGHNDKRSTVCTDTGNCTPDHSQAFQIQLRRMFKYIYEGDDLLNNQHLFLDIFRGQIFGWSLFVVALSILTQKAVYSWSGEETVVFVYVWLPTPDHYLWIKLPILVRYVTLAVILISTPNLPLASPSAVCLFVG